VETKFGGGEKFRKDRLWNYNGRRNRRRRAGVGTFKRKKKRQPTHFLETQEWKKDIRFLEQDPSCPNSNSPSVEGKKIENREGEKDR